LKVSANVKIAMQCFENFGEGKLPPWLRACVTVWMMTSGLQQWTKSNVA